MAPMKIILEMEIGITGGVEDGATWTLGFRSPLRRAILLLHLCCGPGGQHWSRKGEAILHPRGVG